MTLKPVLHQQFMQLRWHLLACLGVIMVLPVAVNNRVVEVQVTEGGRAETPGRGVIQLRRKRGVRRLHDSTGPPGKSG